MSDNKYYDGTELLSKKDINGDTPELFITTSNRSAGKTTYFNRMFTNGWLKRKEKFALLYRYKYELEDVSEKFFKEIGNLFFPNYNMENKMRAKGIYHELLLNDIPCGYAIALNSADQIKKISHLFNDVQRMLFDEFQSETNSYCDDEVKKFISIHNSIARGNGEQTRYVPVYMVGNPVTLLNPYYIELGISQRLKADTHFLRGEGFVLEQGFNESASEAQKSSAFNRAFGNNTYVQYASESIYLNDNQNFIEKPTTRGRYIVTLKYMGVEYAIREYVQEGIIYADDKSDSTFPVKITVTTQDHNINYIMLRNNDLLLNNLRWYFERGCFRFQDLRCKEAVIKSLSY